MPRFVASATPRAAWALLVLLLGCVLYAAFAAGATDLPQESWLQLALLVATAGTAGAWLYGGSVGASASPLAWAGIVALAAFAAWTGFTILWSVAPERSWIELNRGVAYTLAALLGLVVGSSLPRAHQRLAAGLAIVVAPVVLYALGGKTLPGLDFGPINLDHAGGITRLRAPLDYWNALALLTVFGLLPALRLAADPSRTTPRRLFALALVFTAVVVLELTYSRGGILALVVGLVTFIALTTERVRTLALFAGAFALATVPVLIAVSRPELTVNAVPVERREDDALIVLAGFLIALALVLVWGRIVIALERRFAPQTGRRWGRRAAWATLAVVVLGVVNAAATGGFASAVDRFTDTRTADRQMDPSRLLSTNSGNRWTWWKEAAGAWWDEPLAGWGAGSFPVTHKRYRTNLLPVQQPHSVPLQWLAETGLVGLLLAAGALLALLAAALTRVREREWRVAGAPPGRGYAAALYAIPVAWAAHCFYDWDWDIPAVTMPMLVVLGALVARPWRRPAGPPSSDGAGAVRGLGYAGATALVVMAALSAGLPALAETRTEAALAAVGADEVSQERLIVAAADAEVAADLNPLAVEPLFAVSAIAQRRGRIEEARAAILRALERQPDSVDAWLQLARLNVARLDRVELRRAAERALELDPRNPALIALARRAQQAVVAPNESATATGTPLPKTVPLTEPDPVPAPTLTPSPAPTPSPTPP